MTCCLWLAANITLYVLNCFRNLGIVDNSFVAVRNGGGAEKKNNLCSPVQLVQKPLSCERKYQVE